MEHRCAFTGHRKIELERLEYVKGEIRREVLEATRDGYTDFLCGMAQGADLIFASVVAELKQEHKIILEAALPYPKRAATKDPEFQRLLQSCDIVGVHSKSYFPRCFMVRNEFMVQSSTRLIAVFIGGGDSLAATRLMPIHVGGRTIADVIDYVENPEKTRNGELISSYECDSRTADKEFLLTIKQYAPLTGRSQGKSDIIAYHTRQAFKPGEVTPEEANEIGRELAMAFTKGKHSFIVCTHEDRAHVHNHIIFNSTALDCQHKFRNFIGSAFALRRVSDRLCVEHGLSIIKDPNPSRGSYGSWLGEDRPPSFQQQLRDTIDSVLEGKPEDFDAFLAAMLEAGYEAKLGKHLAFLGGEQKKFIRCDTLKGEHTDSAIRERIEGKREYIPTQKLHRAVQPQQKTPSLLIDIQAKILAGKGRSPSGSAGYERFAKVFNLKSAAQTLIYLQEHGLTDYADLADKASAATRRHNTLSDQLKVLESKLTANAELQKQIATYAKTRATYLEYRKSGYSKAFKATHEADILLHQTAKKYFDEHGLSKLPTVASLRTEYAAVLEEKKNAYREFRQARDEMRELLIVKANVDQLLNTPAQPENERQRPEPSR